MASIVTMLWAGHSRVLFLAGARDCYLLKNIRTGCGAHAAFCSMGTSDSFLRDKAHWAWTSPLHLLLNYEQSCTSASQLWLSGMHGDNFTFFFRPCKFEINYVAVGFTERLKFCRPSYIIGKYVQMQWDTSSNRHYEVQESIIFLQTLF
jgi:hypothetical protein